MILLVTVLLVAAALFLTPWRSLTRLERWWAVSVTLATLTVFAVPVTRAESPWRPVGARVLIAALVACALLLLIGLALMRVRHATGRPARALIPTLVIATIPLALAGVVSLLWFIAGRTHS